MENESDYYNHKRKKRRSRYGYQDDDFIDDDEEEDDDDYEFGIFDVEVSCPWICGGRPWVTVLSNCSILHYMCHRMRSLPT